MLLFVLPSILQPVLANAGFSEIQPKQFITVLDEMGERYEVVFSYETKLLRDVKVDFHFIQGEKLESAPRAIAEANRFSAQGHWQEIFCDFPK